MTLTSIACICRGLALTLFLTCFYFPSSRSQAVFSDEVQNTAEREFLKYKYSKGTTLKNSHLSEGSGSMGPETTASRMFSLFPPNVITESFMDLIFENVSQTCATSFGYVLQEMSKVKTVIPETWILQLFDAFGKFPSGILTGHTSELGDFHECVQIRAEYTLLSGSESKEKVKGRYFLTNFSPGPKLKELLDLERNMSLLKDMLPIREKSNLLAIVKLIDPTTVPLMGTCFPASCSSADVQLILNAAHKHLSQGYVTQNVLASYTDEKPAFDGGSYTMIGIIFIIIILCLIGTLLDVQYSTKSNLSSDRNLPVRILLCFSLYKNSLKWLDTRVGSDNLGCLNGLRFLSMSWVVLCHTLKILFILPRRNSVEANQIYKDWTIYPLLNGTVCVDTFFTLGGILVAYHLLRELDKRKGRFNYLLFVARRYLRLTPTYAISIGIVATLLPYTGSGPMWYYIEGDSEKCRKFWWYNLLYVNNILKFEPGPCFIVGWYLADDMQFFLLSPLLIYPLWRWKKTGLTIVAIASLVSIAIPTYIIKKNHLPPTFIPTIPVKSYWTDVYGPPWSRFGPYVTGIFVGFILHQTPKPLGKFRPSIPKCLVISGWALSTSLALLVLFGGIYYFDPQNQESTLTSFHAAAYGGFHRVIWSVCIGWIVFACVNGHGGWVNEILSLKIFLPLGRLTFSMYMVSFHIQFIYHLGQPHPSHFSIYNLVNLFFAHMVMSSLVALFLTIIFEFPFLQLEKIIFAPLLKQPVQNPTESIRGFEMRVNNLDNTVTVKSQGTKYGKSVE